jgi:uncharacterized membrane protein
MAENGENVIDEVKDGASSGGSLGSSLLSKEILIPAVLTAGAAVAARKGPDLVRNLSSNVEKKGEDEAQELGKKSAEGAKKALTGGGGGKGVLGKVAGAALGKAGGGGGGGGPQGKTRRLPIQRWTDVAVPVEVAYREWTNFEEFPKFMHRVLSVNKDDEDKENIVRWEEKIWFSKRQWEGEITDQRRNDRIAWKTKSGMQHAGIVSFHQIGPRLTRVMVTMDFVPQGMIEKMGSGMRFVKRAVQADLARFKAQVEMKDAKGLEYRSGSDDQKEEKKDDEGESRSSGSESRGNGERGRENGSNGDAKDDEEREEDRREREKRRRERQEKVAS